MANMEEIKLNKKQAYRFALSIFADIEQYVENHQEEFEEFLKMEKTKNQKEDFENDY